MARAPSNNQIPVWDWFVRVFHWATVALVATAFLATDDKSIHEPVGYIVLALVVARLVWGVVGGRHARFSDFVTGPATVLRYLRDLARGRARRFIGHNPAGGVMVLALLGLLLVVTVSGWLSETDRFFGVEWISNLHHLSAWLLLLLIVCHLAGVFVGSVLHGEKLILAMLTGRKPARLEGHDKGGATAGSVGGAD